VVPIHATYLLLGHTWQFDRKTKYDGFKNKYSLKKDEKTFHFVPISPRHVYKNQLKLRK